MQRSSRGGLSLLRRHDESVQSENAPTSRVDRDRVEVDLSQAGVAAGQLTHTDDELG